MSEKLKALQRFRDAVVKKAKENLRKQNASGKLSNSIKGEVKEMPNSIGVYFEMEPYGNFQDQGVDGKRVKHGSKYSYKDKMPPPSKLDKWIVRRGIAPRNMGKFSKRKISEIGFKKSIQFLIARSIYYKGIKPTKFFTNAYNDAYKNLPDELIEKYGLDAERDILQILDENLKKR